jgi:hypothetical protein
LAAGKDAEVAVAETNSYQQKWGGEFVVQQSYRVTPRASTAVDPASKPFWVSLTLMRELMPGMNAAWNVIVAEKRDSSDTPSQPK